MTAQFPFLRDVPKWINQIRSQQVPVADLRVVARALDAVLLFPADCSAYLDELFAVVRSAGIKPDAEYLKHLTDEQLSKYLAIPFSRRSDEELATMSLERIAMNPTAIDQLHVALTSAPLSTAWEEVQEAECDVFAIQYGGGWGDAEALAAKLGIELDADSLDLAGAMKGEESSDDHASTRPLVLRWHIAADDAEHIRWEKGAAKDSHAKHLDVQITADTADRLSVMVRGIGYIERGCQVTARWLDLDNNVNAEASVHDRDQPLVLDNSTKTHGKPLSPMHVLELRFEKTSPTPLSFTALIPLHEPPRAAR